VYVLLDQLISSTSWRGTNVAVRISVRFSGSILAFFIGGSSLFWIVATLWIMTSLVIKLQIVTIIH